MGSHGSERKGWASRSRKMEPRTPRSTRNRSFGSLGIPSCSASPFSLSLWDLYAAISTMVSRLVLLSLLEQARSETSVERASIRLSELLRSWQGKDKWQVHPTTPTPTLPPLVVS